MSDWLEEYKKTPMAFELSLRTRLGKSIRNDPEFQRVAKRIRDEAMSARPIVVTPAQKAKAKRRAKNRAARKARRA